MIDLWGLHKSAGSYERIMTSNPFSLNDNHNLSQPFIIATWSQEIDKSAMVDVKQQLSSCVALLSALWIQSSTQFC